MTYRTKIRICVLRTMTWSAMIMGMTFASKVEGETVSFRKQVAPILLDNCIACHGPKKAEGGYRMDSFQAIGQAGESGSRPIGHATVESNELIRRLVAVDPSERMPADSDPLLPEQIAIIRQWISEGCVYDGETNSEPLWKAIHTSQYPPPPEHYNVPVPITSILFSRDGSELYVGGYHEISVWKVADGSLVRRISNIGQRTYAMALLPDNGTLAVACGTPGKVGEVRLIDLASSSVKQTILRTPDVILDIAVNLPKNELAVAATDSSIRLIDLATMTERKTISSHADWINSICCSDDGTKIASASRDKSAKVFDATTGDLLASYTAHAAPVRGIAFLPEGKQVVTTGADNKLHRWDIEGAKKVAEIPVGGEGDHLLRGDGFVLVPSSDKQIHRIHLANNSEAALYKGHEDWVHCIAQYTATQIVATGDHRGEIRVWNIADGTLLRSWIAKP